MKDPWYEDAACKDADVNIFFPDESRARTTIQALAYCTQCPVREQCYREAVDFNIQYGIWGGTTATQRRIIGASRRYLKKYPDGHGDKPGTMAGYWRERYAGLPTCDACRKAYNTRVKENRDRRRNEAARDNTDTVSMDSVS